VTLDYAAGDPEDRAARLAARRKPTDELVTRLE